MDGLDLNYLATCVLEELEALHIVTGLRDEESGDRTSDEWALAHSAIVLALQQGLSHLQQEEGELHAKIAKQESAEIHARMRIRGFEG